jgi:hypothetical protein
MYYSTIAALGKEKLCLVLVAAATIAGLVGGCTKSSTEPTLAPILNLSPPGVVADDSLTGEKLLESWGVLTASEGLPEWKSLRMNQEWVGLDGQVIQRIKYERLNVDPPRSQREIQDDAGTNIEIQIGSDYWQYPVGKDDVWYLDFPYLDEPTGLEFALEAIIRDVQFVGEEKMKGFETQVYTITADTPPDEEFRFPISGKFWLSTDYRFIVRSELLVGPSKVIYELAEINALISISPPPGVE